MIAKQIKHCIPPNPDIAFNQSWLDLVVKLARAALGKFPADFIHKLYNYGVFYALLFISPACVVVCMTSYTKQLAKPFNPDFGMSIL